MPTLYATQHSISSSALLVLLLCSSSSLCEHNYEKNLSDGVKKKTASFSSKFKHVFRSSRSNKDGAEFFTPCSRFSLYLQGTKGHYIETPDRRSRSNE